MKINIHLTPNAKKSEIVGEEVNLFGEKCLKVKVAALPIEGKANKELIETLSKHFKKPRSQIRILKGEASRNKLVELIE